MLEISGDAGPFEEVLEEGRRDETDQVGLERSCSTSTGDGLGEVA